MQRLPAIATAETGFESPIGATPGATRATREQQKTVVWRLDLTPPDFDGQAEIVELVVRGPRSQVEQLQRLGQALAPNDKARHLAAPGHS